MNRKSSGKKGFILASILCFMLILAMLITPLISWSVNEYGWTSRSFMSLQALNLADAGAESAIWEIVYNNELFTSWSGTNPKTIALSSFKDNNDKTIGDIAVSADQTSAQHYTITSTGYVPNAAKPVASKTVKVFVSPKPIFNNAVFGNCSVKLSGITLVDSYDSDLGPYSSLTAGNNGDIGANETLTMLGSASVEGDALIGPDGVTSGVEPRIDGELFYAGNPTELDPVILPSCFDSVPLSPDIKETAGVTDIPTGSYHYEEILLSSSATLDISDDTNIYVSEQISVTGSARIITGLNVNLYVKGDANFAGQGIINSSGLPGNLQIYGLDSGTSTPTTISYSGGSDFYGTVYAPACDISTGGSSSIYGALVGNNVTLSGTGALHYDERLVENGPTQGFNIVYWQEN